MKKIIAKFAVVLITILFSLPLWALNIDEVRVFKSAHRMEMLSEGIVVKTYHVMLGRGGKGPKIKAGDRLVPEGRYILNEKNPYSNFYKSLHVSYPNDEDLKRAEEAGVEPGGDIMIHGYPNRPSLFFKFLQKVKLITSIDWTAGCMAVTNGEMDDIFNNLEVPVPITIYH